MASIAIGRDLPMEIENMIVQCLDEQVGRWLEAQSNRNVPADDVGLSLSKQLQCRKHGGYVRAGRSSRRSAPRVS